MQAPGEPLLFYTGAVLCALVGWRAAAGGFGWLSDRRAARATADRDAAAFREEVKSAAAAARARLANRPAWPGRRPLRVSAVVDEARDVKSFYLTDPDGRRLPSFLPGQHLTVALPTPSSENPTIRCYSLSDRPRSDYYRLTVKRQGSPAGAPDAPPGVGSGWLHDNLRVGDALPCEAPRGVFFHDAGSPRPTVLIGAGVGVTPVVSMLLAIRNADVRPTTRAFFSFADGASHIFRDTLDDLIGEDDPELRIRVAYSRPRDEDRRGVDYQLSGRITVNALRADLPSNNFDFYLCGPPAMMQTLVPDLLGWGVPAEAIHFEAFGPASVTTNASRSLQDRAVGSQVRFNAEDEAVVWDGAHQTLLELAEARGVPVGSGCRAGNCGACRVRVVEGAVSAIKRPGMRLDEGECLACISLPDGPVLLEA